jgi:hypothetical protein
MLGRTVAGMKVHIATPKYVKAIGEKPMEGVRVPVWLVPLVDVGSEAPGADLSNSGKIDLDSQSVLLKQSNEKITILCEKSGI